LAGSGLSRERHVRRVRLPAQRQEFNLNGRIKGMKKRFFMNRFDAEAYALMRIVVGFLFLWHGTSKLIGFPSGSEAPPFVLYIAGPIELIGGIMIMIGLLTRPVAFLCSGLMAAGYWMAHGTQALLPLQNGGELAVAYCFVFLFIAAHGGGKWSVDEAMGLRI
jgi:putative oxidoreductase